MAVLETWDGTGANAMRAGQTWRSRVYDLASDVPGSYTVEWSVNGADWDRTIAYSYTPGDDIAPHKFQVGRRYMRLVYVNGSQDQSYMRYQALSGIRNPLTSKLDAIIEKQADALVARVIDSEVALSDGLFDGRSVVNKFGESPDVDTNETPVDIWGGGNGYTGQPRNGGAETIEVFSDNANDTSGGTGARTVELQGLGADGLLTTEVVTLNGTTPVATVTTWLRMFRMIVLESGDNQTNIGQIIARHTTTTANVFGVVRPGYGQTTVAAFTVPYDQRGTLWSYGAGLARESGGTGDVRGIARLQVRPLGGSWNTKVVQTVTSSKNFEDRPYGGLQLAPGTDIKWTIDFVSNNNCIATGQFDVVLRPV